MRPSRSPPSRGSAKTIVVPRRILEPWNELCRRLVRVNMYTDVADDRAVSKRTNFKTVDALLAAVVAVEPTCATDTTLVLDVRNMKMVWLYRIIEAGFSERLFQRVLQSEIKPVEATALLARKAFLLEPIFCQSRK